MQSIDFLPDTYRRQQRKRKLRGQKIGLSAMIIALLVVWASGELLLLENKSRTVEQLQQRVDSEAAAVKQRRVLDARQRQLSTRMDLHEKLKMPVTYSLVNEAIAQAMPPSIGLTRLEIVADLPTPTPKAKKANTSGKRKPKSAPKTQVDQDKQIVMYVRGIGPDDQQIQQMVINLQAMNLFSQVSFRSSRDEEIDGLNARGFDLVLNIDLKREFVFGDLEEVAHVD